MDRCNLVTFTNPREGFIYQNLYIICSLALGTKELEKIFRDISANSLQFYLTIRKESSYTVEGDSIIRH